MTLSDKIEIEFKKALKAQDKIRLSTLRLVKSATGYAAIAAGSDTLNDGEILKVIRKQAKQRRDAIDQYRKGAREDLAEKEEAELAILEAFLPPPLSPAELDAMVREVIAELGASSKKDRGRVIKSLQQRSAGRADGKSISQRVGALLS